MIVNPYFNSERSFKTYELEAPPHKSVDELLIDYATRKRLEDMKSRGETITAEAKARAKKMATSALYKVLGITG